jgi:AcrR family transcriptional regulator
MSIKIRRSYNSPQREGQANATQRRILGAAEELFAGRGFAAVTMENVARRAGVSLATVYLYFPGKVAIVTALADEVVAAADLSVEQVEQEPDPLHMMRIGTRIIRTLNERSWLVADILRSAHGSDENLASIWTRWQQRHVDAIRRAIRAAHARGALREGLDFDEAVDTFYVLAGTDVFRALVRERGWSPGRYERWLFRLGCTELLGIPPEDLPTNSSCP